MNLSRVCFNTSTFVPDDLAQCLSCVFPVSFLCLVRHMMCLWCSPRPWRLGAANHATDRLEILRVSFLRAHNQRLRLFKDDLLSSSKGF